MPTERSADHSRAFERFVTDESDVNGLVGYALYKQNIAQRRAAGQTVPAPHERDPAPVELEAYRGQAERLLDAVAADAVERAAPSILDNAVIRAQNETRAAMLAELRTRTGLLSNIVTGVIVWLVTVGLTVLLALAEPGWVRNLVAHVSPPQ